LPANGCIPQHDPKENPMTKLIGYMEGADPVWLTTLQVKGYNTMPLSNGMDGHGQHIRLISDHVKPDLIICYLHKLIPPEEAEFTAAELLLPAKLYGVPVLVVCPAAYHPEAADLLPPIGDGIELVDPYAVLDRAASYLK
jgi:hypothetical protein